MHKEDKVTMHNEDMVTMHKEDKVKTHNEDNDTMHNKDKVKTHNEDNDTMHNKDKRSQFHNHNHSNELHSLPSQIKVYRKIIHVLQIAVGFHHIVQGTAGCRQNGGHVLQRLLLARARESVVR